MANKLTKTLEQIKVEEATETINAYAEHLLSKFGRITSDNTLAATYSDGEGVLAFTCTVEMDSFYNLNLYIATAFSGGSIRFKDGVWVVPSLGKDSYPEPTLGAAMKQFSNFLQDTIRLPE